MSFDIISMFPSIGNKIGMSYVITFLDERLQKAPPTKCVIEALELCFNCNNSVFNNTNYIHTDGKTKGPHVLCSYSDIAMRAHSSKTLGMISIQTYGIDSGTMYFLSDYTIPLSHLLF